MPQEWDDALSRVQGVNLQHACSIIWAQCCSYALKNGKLSHCGRPSLESDLRDDGVHVLERYSEFVNKMHYTCQLLKSRLAVLALLENVAEIGRCMNNNACSVVSWCVSWKLSCCSTCALELDISSDMKQTLYYKFSSLPCHLEGLATCSGV